jgi:hypothetical protein
MKSKYIVWVNIFLMISVLSAYSQTLPKGLTIKNDYTPGFGLSLGKIVLLQGNAVIVHYHDKQVGYTAKQGMLLYQKDKIITLDNGRVSFQLNDGSQMSMASNATMTINKSVFDPVKKDRSVFMNMPIGKSRFTVRKLTDFRRSAVKIKTNTAIIGVRGSDFIVMASEQTTEIVTLDDTLLEVSSLFDPSAEAVLIQAYERSEVQSQALPTQPEPLRPEEIDSIMEDFSFSLETASHGALPASKNMSAGKSPKNQKSSDISQSSESTDSSRSDDANVADTQTTDSTTVETKSDDDQTTVASQPVDNQSVTSAPVDEPVLVSDDIIEAPEPVDMVISETMEPQIDIVDVVPIQEMPYETIQDVQVDIVEDQSEDEFKSKLPGLPAKP